MRRPPGRRIASVGNGLGNTQRGSRTVSRAGTRAFVHSGHRPKGRELAPGPVNTWQRPPHAPPAGRELDAVPARSKCGRDRRHGFPLSYGNLRRRVLVPAAHAAGLEWVTFHTFRHTCASLLFEAGRDVKQVSAWLGHTDPAFTLRTYVHLMDNGIGDAAFMDQVFATSVEAGNSVRSAVPLPPQ